MKAYWLALQARFDQRKRSERALIALVLLALLYLLFDLLLFQSLDKRQASLQARFQAAQQAINSLTAEEKIVSTALLNNPNAQKKQEILRLDQRVKELDTKIADLQVGLIAAQQLPDVIRRLLAGHSGLQLLGLQALAPTRIGLQDRAIKNTLEKALDQSVASDSVDEAGIYSHPVVFRLKGSYFDIMNYLQTLENSPWNFYWSSLDYRVERYPEAIVQVEAYTVSTDKGFIDE